MARTVPALLLLAALLLAPPGPAAAQGHAAAFATLNWEPYIGTALEEQGPLAAIAREAMARSGYDTKLVFLPWSRAVRDTRRGLYQGFWPGYPSRAHDPDLACSAPVPGGPLALFVRPGEGFAYHGVADLRGRRLGVVRNYVNTAEIDSATGLDREVSSTDLENLRKLMVGRVDVVVEDAFVGRHLARLHLGGAHAIELLAVLEEKSFLLCTPRSREDHAAVLAAFNAGLESMRADGTLDAILARHGMAPMPSTAQDPSDPAPETSP